MKQENLEETDCLASLDFLDPQVMQASAQGEKKDFKGFQVLRDVLEALESRALAMMEHLACVETLENPVYLVLQVYRVHLERKDKLCLAYLRVRQETQAIPVSLDNQVLKVNQGCKGPLDVQGLMAPKEKEETPAPEACVDLKVSLDPEGTLVFQVSQGRVLMGPGVRTVSQAVLEPRASLERC